MVMVVKVMMVMMVIWRKYKHDMMIILMGIVLLMTLIMTCQKVSKNTSLVKVGWAPTMVSSWSKMWNIFKIFLILLLFLPPSFTFWGFPSFLVKLNWTVGSGKLNWSFHSLLIQLVYPGLTLWRGVVQLFRPLFLLCGKHPAADEKASQLLLLILCPP